MFILRNYFRQLKENVTVKGITLILVVSLAAILAPPLTQAQQAFEPLGHRYIYDVGGDGNVKCTWETTIIPLQPSILYSFTFRGGTVSDTGAIDSLGQELDVDVEELDGQRTVNLFLFGYEQNEAYTFNFSFAWSGMLTRKGDRHTLFTSVNVGDPQSASIIVILPDEARLGASTISRGNITEFFEKELISGRDALVWQVTNTGNETAIVFSVNFRHYSALLWMQDNLIMIIAVAVIVFIGALLLGYWKRRWSVISKARKFISEKF
jgi:hypothetical protein